MEVPRVLVTPFHRRLEELVEGFSLKRAFAKISKAYREGQNSRVLTERADYLAYAAARMPATYAVLEKVLTEVQERLQRPVRTVLDLGSGPGTAFWASPFEGAVFTAVEQDPEFIRLAQDLGGKMRWINMPLERYEPEEVDLALFSYVINELKDPFPVIAKIFAKANVLVIVEPGTPKAFARLKEIRTFLIEQGAFILAPCPANVPCPSNWCHFYKRLPRSRLHRMLKEGDLGYEDEKFCYLVVTKGEGRRAAARIVAEVEKQKGKTVLPLCQEGQLVSLTLKKSRLKWGDALETLNTEPEEDREKGNCQE